MDGTGSSKEQSNITTGTKTEAPTFYIFDTTNAIKPLIWQNALRQKLKRNLTLPSLTPYLTKIFTNGVCVLVVAAGFGFWQLAHCVEKTELTAENIMDVIAKMQSLKGDGGKLLNIP